MTDLDQLIRTRGGAIATHELYAAGVSRSGLGTLVRSGRLWRPRQGWYVLPGTAQQALRAVRVGGRATCSTALSAAGVWVPRDRRLHVRVDDNDCRLRTAQSSSMRRADHPDDQLIVHWRDVLSTRSRLLCDVLDALDDYRACAPRDWYLAALDSSIHGRPEFLGELRRRGHVDAGTTVDGLCESGIETLCWIRLLCSLNARRQIEISGVGRVDFMVGSRLAIEVDGAAFHDTASGFEEDRRRDARLSALGYRVLRFSYRQVMQNWPQVEAAIWAAVARGDHH